MARALWYETFGLPWDDWLAWAEGETVTVRLPRTHFAEPKEYKGTAPLFATMADLFSYPVKEARETGRSIEKENRQFRSRWAIIVFKHAIPKEERDVTIVPCPRCAAQWYAGAVRDVLAEPKPQPFEPDSLRKLDVPPAVPGAVPSSSGPRGFFEELKQLMAWQAEGRLTDSEFEAAKRRLGL